MTIRRVRTPEGAEHYGQPIGSIITADGDVNLPKKLKAVIDGFKTETYFDHGEQEEKNVADLTDSSHSSGQCAGASMGFWQYTNDRGIPSEGIETWYGEEGNSMIHYASVVVMDGVRWVVDYAFRQFEEDSPWPLVIPLDEYVANPGISSAVLDNGEEVKGEMMAAETKRGGVMTATMETKIRRVRTPEGVAKYGQPIGSVIVADATPSRRRLFGNSTSKVPLPAPDKAPKRVTRARTTKEKIDRRGVPKLNKTSSPYKGWLAWQRSDSEATYYVGPDPKREGSYVAVDKSGKVIARGPSQGEAKIALDQTIGTYKPDMERGDYGHLQEVEDKKALEAWRKKFGVKLPPGGQYEITTDESKDIIGRYIDVHGDVRNIRNPKVVEAGQVEKWKRVSALSKDLAAGKLGKELEKDALTSQTAAAVLLMRRTGMRAASSSDRQRGETFAYGATNLLNSHIKEGPNGVIVVELTTKKGQDYRKEISDPALVAAIKTWWDPSDPRGHVFPDTNSEKTIDYIRAKTGGEYGNHDLRRYMGSLIAATMVRRIGRARPKTMAEYKTMVKRISEEVAAQLGNTPDQALNYYIDPAIFSAWKDAL